MTSRRIAIGLCGMVSLASVAWAVAQDRPARETGPATQPGGGPGGAGPGGFGPGGMGPGGFGGRGGPGGPMGGPDRALVKQFDKDNDGRLNTDERKAARAAAKAG